MPISLVTGGAGFIGTHISIELIQMGHQVIVLDDLSGGKRSYLAPEVVFIQGSIVDHHLVEKIFSENNIDYIYHLAAYAAEGLSHFIKRFNYTNNLIGSVNLINEAVKHKVKCFVFTSSIAVYGALPPPMREDMIPIPEDPYGIAKLAVEHELRVTKEMFGLNYVIFRPHNVYGAYQNLGDKYRNVVGIFINQIMKGYALTVFGDGQQSRAFSYIGDVAPQIAKCVEIKATYGEVFNIGADYECTIKELAEVLMKAMGSRVELRYLAERNEVVHTYASHEKVRRVFGNYPLTTLEDGVQKMVEWAKEEGSVTSCEKFKNIEITEKLPTVWLED